MITPATRDEIKAIVAEAIGSRRSALSEPEAKSLLRALQIPVPPGEVVPTVAAAAEAVELIGAPVVVKAVSHAITHKSDLGGILFPIDSGPAAEQACETIAARVKARRPDVTLDGFLIEAYRPSQPEWILALRMDPTFGPAVMFGLGGIFVQVMRQVSFRLAPLAERDIDALLTEKPITRILSGMRGKAPADWQAIRRVIRILSDVAECDEVAAAISEIEINPLTITEHGVLALDALVVLRHQETVP
jgi:succinyl-CoA synthetase beta subunit